MAKMPTADNDIINMNVGGTVFATKRSTLTQVCICWCTISSCLHMSFVYAHTLVVLHAVDLLNAEEKPLLTLMLNCVCNISIQADNSMLAAWFSGRWEQCLDRDDQGHIFLDFDPDLFQLVLSALCCYKGCSGPDPKPLVPPLDPIKQEAFADLVRYLALEDFMGYPYSPIDQPRSQTFVSATSAVSVSENRQKAQVVNSCSNCQSILVKPACSSCCYLEFRIVTLEGEIFVGVGNRIDVGSARNHAQSLSFGWDSICGLHQQGCSSANEHKIGEVQK